MSRGVRDLRQLISQSRQAHIDDHKDVPRSDSDDYGSEGKNKSSNHNGRVSMPSADIKSNCHVSSLSDFDYKTSSKLLQHVSSADSGRTACLRLRCSNPRPLSDTALKPAHQLHELPKCSLLPTVKSDCCAAKSRTSHQQTVEDMDRLQSDSSLSQSVCCLAINDRTSTSASDKHMTVNELDVFLQLFDRSVVRVWLEQTKRSITDICDWCAGKENFVRFAHFWLSEFPCDRRCSLFEFEYDLLRDKIATGCRNKDPSPEQLSSFFIVILHEFPKGRLTGLADAYVFLDHLEAIAESCKRDRLLAALLYSSQNPQYYDCLLAMRSYAIVSIWSAILDRYRSGLDSAKTSLKSKSSRPSTARVARASQPSSASSQLDAALSRPSTARSKSSLGLQCEESEMTLDVDISSQQRLFDAIRLGFEDVVQYLLETGKVSVDVCDADNKTVVFHAVTSSQPAVLRYLLHQCSQSGFTSVVNAAANSGNTPLHAAVNRGNVPIIRDLLSCPDIEVDAVNRECDDVTPLLLAAMHGHADIVELFLDAGADWSRTMGSKTAHEIAIDFDNLNVADVLERNKSKSQ